MIVDDRLQMDSSARIALADNIRFIEEQLEVSQTRLEGVAAELDRLRRYHQQILSDLPLGVCALAPDGRIVTWNQVMTRMSGVKRRVALGMTVDSLPPPWPGLFRRCLEASDSHLHKVEAAAGERRRSFNLHKAVIEYPGEPDSAGGVVILVEDRTEIQSLESELAHSERLASIGRLAAGVAHEIGNPVTGIACLAQNLETDTTDDEAKLTSREIMEQTKRISEILQSLVGFSHGGVRLSETRPVFVNNCIEEAARLVSLSHTGRQVRIVNGVTDQICITGDATQLVQVFVNLLSNACDASGSGNRVEISARRNGGTVSVEVADEGHGIPENILGQVFDPFVTTKPPGSGTGLGLSVVYRIVQEHRGHISIDSQPGSGTRVRITFPLTPVPGTESAVDAAATK
jgi:signal transduction histidine kinase